MFLIALAVRLSSCDCFSKGKLKGEEAFRVPGFKPAHLRTLHCNINASGGSIFLPPVHLGISQENPVPGSPFISLQGIPILFLDLHVYRIVILIFLEGAKLV